MVRQIVSRLRPAPLQAAVAKVLRLDRPIQIEVEGLSILADPVSVVGTQLLAGNFEPWLTSTLRRELKPDMTFLDLGANIGYFSALASRLVGPRGTVIAVEPQSRLQRQLARNMQLNHSYNVRVVQAIVSDKPGTAELHLAYQQNQGSSSLYPRVRYGLRTETVRALTLTELVDNAAPSGAVDFVKMDIEGAEYEVLTSSADLLRSGRLRVLNIDFHDQILAQRGLSKEPVLKLLEDCGYVIEDHLWKHRLSH